MAVAGDVVGAPLPLGALALLRRMLLFVLVLQIRVVVGTAGARGAAGPRRVGHNGAAGEHEVQANDADVPSERWASNGVSADVGVVANVGAGVGAGVDSGVASVHMDSGRQRRGRKHACGVNWREGGGGWGHAGGRGRVAPAAERAKSILMSAGGPCYPRRCRTALSQPPPWRMLRSAITRSEKRDQR